jgi:serine/threonine-protein kinase RsbT
MWHAAARLGTRRGVDRLKPRGTPRASRSQNLKEDDRPEVALTTRRRVAQEIRVRITSNFDVVSARQKGRELARDRGFRPTDLAIIATAISELARNIVLYARGGEIILKSTDESDPSGILVVALDEGPGIPDIAKAINSGYSTSGGMGLGLPGVRRLMDEFEIVSELGRGTTVKAIKWKR